MSERIKISIIVPIYNVEKYLEECVKSLVGQTYENIEIILVDDGSTDNSGKICDRLMEQDKRIFVFHKENGRTASARNLGVKKANGEYVLFIDPDDWFEKSTVEILVNKIKSTNADVLRFNYVKEYGNFFQENQNCLIEEKIYQGEEFNQIIRKNLGLIGKELKNIEHFNFLASVCFGCYKKDLILNNDIEFTDIDKIGSFSDGLFNLQYLLNAKSFVYVDQCFYHYRKNNNGAYTKRSKKNFFEKNLVLFNELKKIVDENNLDIEFEKACYNRIAYCVLELNLNVVKDIEMTVKKGCRQIKAILKNEIIRKAIKRFDIKNLPLKWKIYYAFVKTRWALGIYLVTKAILNLKGKK